MDWRELIEELQAPLLQIFDMFKWTGFPAVFPPRASSWVCSGVILGSWLRQWGQCFIFIAVILLKFLRQWLQWQRLVRVVNVVPVTRHTGTTWEHFQSSLPPLRDASLAEHPWWWLRHLLTVQDKVEEMGKGDTRLLSGNCWEAQGAPLQTWARCLTSLGLLVSLVTWEDRTRAALFFNCPGLLENV